MFNVGDIVMIQTQNRTLCMEDSPALNLEGSICEIVDVNKVTGLTRPFSYRLKMIELKTKKPELYKDGQMNMVWRDHNLVLVKEYNDFELNDSEIMDVFNYV